MNVNYYIPQTSESRSLIHSIWQVEGQSAFKEEHIIPKGIVEVIFNFSDCPIPAQMADRQYQLSNAFINGFNTVPIQLQLPKKQVFFGVVFQPLSVKKIFKTPAAEFADLPVDLELIDPAFNSLWHRLAEQPDFDRRVSVLLEWLKTNVIDWQPQEQLLNRFLYSGDQFDLTVNKLSDTLCYSPRHVARKIFEVTGMNTEEMLLYKKYQRAVDLMHHAELSLTDIAHHCQFFDQSHFIRTFKAYAGITPGKYKRNKSNVKAHLYDIVR